MCFLEDPFGASPYCGSLRDNEPSNTTTVFKNCFPYELLKQRLLGGGKSPCIHKSISTKTLLANDPNKGIYGLGAPPFTRSGINAAPISKRSGLRPLNSSPSPCQVLN